MSAMSVLHSQITGSGTPVVMLHGLFGSSDNLRALATAIAEDHQVHRLDLPNHGRSSHCLCGIEDMAAAVQGYLDHHGLSGCWLVGHSLGGKVAMALAGFDPARYVGVVVLDISPVEYPPHHAAVFRGLEAVAAADVSSRAEADERLAEHVADPGVRAFLLKSLARVDDGGWQWQMGWRELRDSYDRLSGMPDASGVFPGPLLVLKGEHSTYVQPEHESAFRARFADITFRVVAGTGHWLHAEKPALVGSLVAGFLRRHN